MTELLTDSMHKTAADCGSFFSACRKWFRAPILKAVPAGHRYNELEQREEKERERI